MTASQGPAAGGGVRILAVPSAVSRLSEVIALGDRHRKTLGPPLPPVVFEERASAGQLLAAVADGGALLGYALYEISLGRIRLIHLCVDETARGRGIARRLVDELSARHPDLPGIRVTCRADYEAAAVWPRLGFTCTNERPGRGKTGEPLQIWWRSHGLEDLLTLADETADLVVVIDHNVFIDLAVDPQRQGAEESSVLRAGHMEGVVALAVTNETLNEITKIPCVDERKRQRALATGFHQLGASPRQLQAVRDAVSAQLAPLLSASDLAHLVHAGAAGAAVFVTRDAELIRDAREIAFDRLGLRLMRPAEVVLYLAELEHAERFRPAALHATSCLIQDESAGVEDRFAGLIATGTSERRSQFNALLRRLTADTQTRIRHISDAADNVLVLWAETRQRDAITLPLLRLGSGTLADTVVRLVLFELRTECLRAGKPRLQVLDAHLDARARLALLEDGFQQVESGPTAYVCSSLSRAATAAQLPDDLGAKRELIDPSTSLRRLAALEAQFWPAKLLDAGLRSWIVPIQPGWARELLGLDEPLLPRRDLLGLSRELVYYRSARGQPNDGPGRILWYASDTSVRGIGAIVGCSQIRTVVKDEPDRLYQRFQHLGVYERKNVLAAAGRGKQASAIVFTNTQLFASPVPYGDLERLDKNRRTWALRSPTLIEPELFGAVYMRGVGHRERG